MTLRSANKFLTSRTLGEMRPGGQRKRVKTVLLQKSLKIFTLHTSNSDGSAWLALPSITFEILQRVKT